MAKFTIESAHTAPIDTSCTLCHGRQGWQVEVRGTPGLPSIYVADAWVVCPCEQARRAAGFLARTAPDLVEAPVVDADADVVGLLSRCIRVVGAWASVAPDLRAAVLAHRASTGFFKPVIYRDSELPSLAFADVQARYRDQTDAPSIDSDADLIIVRLGFMAKAHAQVPSTLADLIANRVDRLGLGLWIIEDPRRPLQQGHPAWSTGLQEQLGRLDRVVWGAS